MAAKKNAADLRAENRLLRQVRTSEGIVSVVNNMIKWGGLVCMAYLAYRTVSVLAGRVTLANVGIRFLADVRVSEFAAWLLGFGGTFYGVQQRKLRRDTVERLQARITRFEREKDPKRSSSSLTPRGETRPEDEP